MTKKKIKCKHLEQQEAERLAKLIISEAENQNWHTVDRKQRVPSPPRSVMIF